MASITCPNCQTVSAEGTAFCPGCGNALSGAAQAAYTPPPSATAGIATAVAAARCTARRSCGRSTHPGQVRSASRSATLTASPGAGPSSSSSPCSCPGSRSTSPSARPVRVACTIHGYLYITLILSLAIIAFVVAEALGMWKLPSIVTVGREQILLIATAINFVLVLIAFLFKPRRSRRRMGLGCLRRHSSPRSWRCSPWAGRSFRPAGASRPPRTGRYASSTRLTGGSPPRSLPGRSVAASGSPPALRLARRWRSTSHSWSSVTSMVCRRACSSSESPSPTCASSRRCSSSANLLIWARISLSSI